MSEVIDAFLAQALNMVAELHLGTLQSDAAALRYRAHALHGSALALGAREMQVLCARLESLAVAGDAADATLLIDPLIDALRRAAVALTAIRGEETA